MAPPKHRHATAAFAAPAVLAAGAAVPAEEKCIFDRAAQLAQYREMERRIQGARYSEADRVLIVERGAATITVGRGGCVHFGLRLMYTAPAAPGDADRDVAFARAVALVAEFGGGELLTADEVAAVIRNEEFELAQEGLYDLRVPGVAAFSIMQDITDGRPTVEVAYYIN